MTSLVILFTFIDLKRFNFIKIKVVKDVVPKPLLNPDIMFKKKFVLNVALNPIYVLGFLEWDYNRYFPRD